jgi:hypothetical protein
MPISLLINLDPRIILGSDKAREYMYSQPLFGKTYYQQSKSSRDIAAILTSTKNELDLDFIEGWVSQLGLSSLWKEMLDNVS